MKAAFLLRAAAPLACLAAVAFGGGSAKAEMALMDGGATYQVKVYSFIEIPWRTVVRQQYDYSCGSAALATLLHYHYDRPVTETQVFKDMYAAGDQEKIRKVGFSLLDMKKYLEAKGLKADGYRATVKTLEKAKAPSIAVVNIADYKHFVVIKGVRDGKVLIGDPAQGLKSYTYDEFTQMWDGIIFMVHEDKKDVALFNRVDEWQIWPSAPSGEPFSTASLSGFTRELPPVYQVAPMFNLDAFFAQ